MPASTPAGVLFLLVLVAAVAATLTTAASIKLRDLGPDAKQLEGDSSEWVKELRRLQRILPDDREWAASISGFIDGHRSEVVDMCNFNFAGCTVQHEIESITIEQPIGTVDWSAIPSTVTFVTFMRGHFTFDFDFGTAANVQSLQYVGCHFGQPMVEFDDEGVPHYDSLAAPEKERPKCKGAVGPSKTRLHEVALRQCGLPAIPWLDVPPVFTLDLSGNAFLEVPFKTLPRNLRFLNLSFAFAKDAPAHPTGEHLWEELPQSLVSLDLAGCGLSSIGPLPRRLEELILRNNSITSLVPSGLPSGLTKLNLAFNQLTGELPDLTALSVLQELDVTGNQLTSLPLADTHLNLATIRAVRANGNRITAPVAFDTLPKTLRTLELADNGLQGTARLTRLPEGMETLDLQGNALSGPVDLTALPLSMRFLYLQRNGFTGHPDLSKLPVDLRRIFFGENNWDSLMPHK